MLLVDGDILVYRVGFAVDASTVDIDPTKKAHLYLNKMLKKYLRDTGQKHYEIYITDTDVKNNFRYNIATMAVYKGNRSGGDKPIMYDIIREILVAEYGAVEVSGIEADDKLGHLAGSGNIIASIDKDLMMLPGHHYNMNTGDIIEARDYGYLTLCRDAAGKRRLKGVGIKWFFAQLLTGDVTDNILGLPGYGDVTAHRALMWTKDISEGWEVVKNAYSHYPDKDLYENGHLLWIQRKPEDKFYEYM